MKLRSHADLARYVGADDVARIERRVYKDTDCGAWVDLQDPKSVLVGTIVEGSDVEPIVAPRRLHYPCDAKLWDQAVEAIEADAEACWQHVNECSEGCDGQACGYVEHCGAIEVNMNPPKVRRRPERAYRVTLAPSIVGWVLVRTVDLVSHRSLLAAPPVVRVYLGAERKRSGRDVVASGTSSAAALDAMRRGEYDGCDAEFVARVRGGRLIVTTPALRGDHVVH